jgi:hypothetical protein
VGSSFHYGRFWVLLGITSCGLFALCPLYSQFIAYTEKTIEKLNLKIEQDLSKANKDKETMGTQQKNKGNSYIQRAIYQNVN